MPWIGTGVFWENLALIQDPTAQRGQPFNQSRNASKAAGRVFHSIMLDLSKRRLALPVETMPDNWIVAACPLCGQRRRYLPSEIFRGSLSHKFLGGQHRVVVR